jgi:hypothetical protein
LLRRTNPSRRAASERRGFDRLSGGTSGCHDLFPPGLRRYHATKKFRSFVGAEKGGDNIGFSGHKKVKGDQVVAFCDRNCNVIAPFISAPGNQNESPLLREALPEVTRIAGSIGLDLRGTVVSLDGVYDCRRNRKSIFNRGMVPNINPNPRGRKAPKRGRKPFFDEAIFQERFNTIERVFGWEDKFRRLLLRFERISQLHYAFKSLAYSMINLRHFC